MIKIILLDIGSFIMRFFINFILILFILNCNLCFAFSLSEFSKKEQIYQSDTTKLYSVMKNDLYGVINDKNEIILPIEYARFVQIPPSGMYIVKNLSYGYFSFKEQKIIIPCEYQDVEIKCDIFEENPIEFYFVTYKSKKWLFDINKQEIVSPAFNTAMLTGHEHNFLVTTDSGNYIFNPFTYEIKKLNYDKFEKWYYGSYFKTELNGKIGICELSGKEILSPEFDEISIAFVKSRTTFGNFICKKDNKFGLYSKDGKQILKNEYKILEEIGSKYILTVDFNDKYQIFVVQDDEAKPLDIKYSRLTKVFDNFLICQSVNNKYGLISLGVDEILTLIEAEYDEITYLNYRYFLIKKDNKYGLTYYGRIVVPCDCDSVEYLGNGYYKLNKNNKYAYYDSKGNRRVLSDFIYEDIKLSNNPDSIMVKEDILWKSIPRVTFEDKFNDFKDDMQWVLFIARVIITAPFSK